MILRLSQETKLISILFLFIYVNWALHFHGCVYIDEHAVFAWTDREIIVLKWRSGCLLSQRNIAVMLKIEGVPQIDTYGTKHPLLL